MTLRSALTALIAISLSHSGLQPKGDYDVMSHGASGAPG